MTVLDCGCDNYVDVPVDEVEQTHSCPYAYDIGGIDDDYCDCCLKCTAGCADDI